MVAVFSSFATLSALDFKMMGVGLDCFKMMGVGLATAVLDRRDDRSLRAAAGRDEAP